MIIKIVPKVNHYISLNNIVRKQTSKDNITVTEPNIGHQLKKTKNLATCQTETSHSPPLLFTIEK